MFRQAGVSSSHRVHKFPVTLDADKKRLLSLFRNQTFTWNKPKGLITFYFTERKVAEDFERKFQSDETFNTVREKVSFGQPLKLPYPKELEAELYEDSVSSEEDEGFAHTQEDDDSMWMSPSAFTIEPPKRPSRIPVPSPWPDKIDAIPLSGRSEDAFIRFVSPRWTPAGHVSDDTKLKVLEEKYYELKPDQRMLCKFAKKEDEMDKGPCRLCPPTGIASTSRGSHSTWNCQLPAKLSHVGKITLFAEEEVFHYTHFGVMNLPCFSCGSIAQFLETCLFVRQLEAYEVHAIITMSLVPPEGYCHKCCGLYHEEGECDLGKPLCEMTPGYKFLSAAKKRRFRLFMAYARALVDYLGAQALNNIFAGITTREIVLQDVEV